MNAYKLLGIPRNASQQQIRTAYLLKVKEAHPDSPTGSDAKFKEIHQAYLSLKGLKHKSVTEENDIDFKNIIKFYTKVNHYRKTNFESPLKSNHEPVEKKKNGFFLQGLFYASVFLYIWNLDTDSEIADEFHDKYLKECNQVEYSYYDEAISHTKKINSNPNIYA